MYNKNAIETYGIFANMIIQTFLSNQDPWFYQNSIVDQKWFL